MGTLLGLVPFGGAGEQLAEAHDFVGRGTPAAQRGKAVGLIVGGLYSMVSGTGGEILGGAETATGVGAPVGAATIAVSTTMVDVRIELSGSRMTDFARANAAAGLKQTPPGYTWHHHQDRGLMQLVESRVHRYTGHSGGFGQ
ncbi:MAG: HNH endonuclease [Polyangiaceae bacterium]